MATSFLRRREVLPATAPKFFKIILHPESDTLRIPKEFTRRHRQNLRNRVFLKVPEGSAMEVELIQSSSSNGEAWLQKGWLEFKERYSIGFGYLLVFIYNGNSQFNVLIFDPTASEITYPVEETQSAESDDDSVSRNLLAEKQRKRRNNSTIEFPSKSNRDAREGFIAYQKALAYKGGAKAKGNNSHKPFFISLMRQAYVSHRFLLNVPVWFAKTSFQFNGTERKIKSTFPTNGTIKLHLMMNGKKWRVKCWVEAGYKKAKLFNGWKKFALDNGLKIGDACVFEVHKSTELVWDVVIFRS